MLRPEETAEGENEGAQSHHAAPAHDMARDERQDLMMTVSHKCRWINSIQIPSFFLLQIHTD